MLRVLILSKSSPRSCGNLLSLEERFTYFPQVFELCKNLQRIDIDTGEQRYQRWLRDGSLPSYISDFDEVLLPEWNIS